MAETKESIAQASARKFVRALQNTSKSNKLFAVLAGLCVALAGITLFITLAAGEATMYLKSASANVDPGQTVTVEVRINTGGENVNAVQAEFTYPKESFQFVSIDDAGSAFGIAAPSTGGEGRVSIARGSTTNVGGDVLVAKVNFTVLAASGDVPVAFVANSSYIVSSADSANILSSNNMTGTTYTVGTPTPPPAPTPTPTPSPTPTPTPSPTPTPPPASGVNKMYLKTDANNVAQNTEFPVEIRINTEAEVNSVQANLSYDPNKLEYVSSDFAGTAFGISAQTEGGNGSVLLARGTITPVSGDKLVATVLFRMKATTGSAAVNVDDESVILSSATSTDVMTESTGVTIAAATVTPSPAPTPPPPAPSPSPSPTPTPTPTPSPTPTPPPAPEQSKLYLEASTASVATGGTFSVAIRLYAAEEINAVQTNLVYDPSKLDYVSTDFSGSDFGIAATSAYSIGSVQIARGTIVPVEGNNLVGTVTFSMKADSGSVPINFSNDSVMVTSDDSSALSAEKDGAVLGVSSTPTPPPPAPPAPPVIIIPNDNTEDYDPEYEDEDEDEEPVTARGTTTLEPAEERDDTIMIEYSVDGEPIVDDTVDTTELSEGEHVVAMKEYKTDGTTDEGSTTIKVDNKRSPLEFLAENPVVAAAGGAVLLAGGVGGAMLIRRRMLMAPVALTSSSVASTIPYAPPASSGAVQPDDWEKFNKP